MKKVLSVLFILVVAFALFAEGRTESNKFVVGITTYSTETVFSRNARECLKEYITAAGGRYIDNVATNHLDRATAVENFIAQGVDAIILLSGDVAEVEETLKEARSKGIVLGSCDGGIVDCIDIYASSDNFKIGQQVVTELMKAMNMKGNILKIYSNNGSMDRARQAGGADVLSIPVKKGGGECEIKYLLHYIWPDYFEDCKQRTAAFLLANDDIDGIFATFDGVGLAALQAVKESGKTIPVVGVDGDPEALNEIADPDSCFVATVIQSWTACAQVVVDNIFSKLNGGNIALQSVQVPGILVTKENVLEVKAKYPDLFVL